MTYRANIAVRAERDLASLFRDINAPDSHAALKWYRGLQNAILKLEEKPNRCPVTPESRAMRHLLYGKKPHVYRVIYRVQEKQKQVDVLHIRHGAREKFGRSDATQTGQE